MKFYNFYKSLFVIFICIVSKGKAKDVQFTITQHNKCLVSNKSNIIRTLSRVSLQDCVSECGNRQDCQAVNYRRRVTIGELINSENGILVKSNIQTGPCALVVKSDIKKLPSCNCNAGEVCEGNVCTTKECKTTTLENTETVGNIKTIGSHILYNCDQDYVNTGQGNATCIPPGTWSGQPKCVADCGTPDNVSGANRSFTTTTETSLVTYACLTGYTQTSGDLQLVCSSDGHWNGVLPKCTIDCGTPPTLSAANISFTTTVESSLVTYTCQAGYSYTGGDLQLVCGSDGKWGGVSPICTTDCGTPATVSGANSSFTSTTENSLVTYTCSTGFTQTGGDLRLVCGSDGKWDGVSPICTTDCGTPATVSGASRSFTSTTENSLVTYTCLIGYTQTGGDLQLVCGSDGKWGGLSPICKIDCGTPAIVSGASRSFTSTTENSLVTYTCVTGYTQTGGDLLRVCGSDGKWGGVWPTCKIDCGTPVTVSGASRSFTTTTESSLVTYACKTGYTQTGGDLQLVCGSGGQWGGVSPTCTIVSDCGTPATVSGASRAFTTTTENSLVTYTCQTGYTQTGGDLQLVCGSDGKWGGVSPVCTVVCAVPPNVPNSVLSSGTLTTGSQRTFSCTSGNYFATGATVITSTCQSDGQWSYMDVICPRDSAVQACPGCGILRDCEDVQSLGLKQTGKYLIYPTGNVGINVRCDMDEGTGGWTIIQRRISASDFQRTWAEYKNGFGSVDDNYWLGNDNIATLTNLGSYKIRFDLYDQTNVHKYAEYSTFSITDESQNYRLTVSGYSGNAGESFLLHNGKMFTTKDVDNDTDENINCSIYFSGAWWFSNCHNSNLNGLYGSTESGKGVMWFTFTGLTQSLSVTEMKIIRK